MSGDRTVSTYPRSFLRLAGTIRDHAPHGGMIAADVVAPLILETLLEAGLEIRALRERIEALEERIARTPEIRGGARP